MKYVVQVYVFWEAQDERDHDITEYSGIIHDTFEDAQRELDKAREEGYMGFIDPLGHLEALEKSL